MQSTRLIDDAKHPRNIQEEIYGKDAFEIMGHTLAVKIPYN